MTAPEPLHYPRMKQLGAALAIACLVGAEVDVVLNGTILGATVARDACLGLLPCSGDYSASAQRGMER